MSFLFKIRQKDEPLSALDHNTRLDLRHEIIKIKQNRNIPIILSFMTEDEEVPGAFIININHEQMRTLYINHLRNFETNICKIL